MSLLNKFFEKFIDKDAEFIKIVKASDCGEAWAKNLLRKMWEKNEPDLFLRVDKARVRIYEEAARKGDAHAQYMLGISLFTISFNEAMKWLGPLIENGNTEAMKAIGDQYTKHGCWGENKTEWLKWYLRAAEKGDAKAQVRIALQYSVMGDKSKADYWYEQAANRGNADGLKGVADNKTDLLRRRLIKPENETVEQWGYINDKLYCEAEEKYFAALEAVEDDVGYSVICSSLAGLYESFCDIYTEDAEKSAFFYYEAYLTGENEYALSNFKRIVEKYHLDVDTSDLHEWAKKLKLEDK